MSVLPIDGVTIKLWEERALVEQWKRDACYMSVPNAVRTKIDGLIGVMGFDAEAMSSGAKVLNRYMKMWGKALRALDREYVNGVASDAENYVKAYGHLSPTVS